MPRLFKGKNEGINNQGHAGAAVKDRPIGEYKSQRSPKSAERALPIVVIPTLTTC